MACDQACAKYLPSSKTEKNRRKRKKNKLNFVHGKSQSEGLVCHCGHVDITTSNSLLKSQEILRHVF